MTSPYTEVRIYSWFDLQAELCNLMGIPQDKFRRYHDVDGGEYKDFWHVCLNTIIPYNMNNDSIVTMYMYSTDPELVEGEEDQWQNLVLVAWNKLYAELSPDDSGISVSFSW
jgi:hypothetical protein